MTAVGPRPAANHHFGDDLTCLCGVSFAEHQAEPSECDVTSKLGELRDRACKRGHPRTEDFGWYRKASRNGRPAWVCGKCKELWESGRGRR